MFFKLPIFLGQTVELYHQNTRREDRVLGRKKSIHRDLRYCPTSAVRCD